MKYFCAAIFNAAVVLMSGCAAGGDAQNVSILNPTVAAAFANFDETMASYRTPLSFENGTVVTSCEAYLAARTDAKIEEGIHNRIVSQEYLICDTIAALDATIGARVGHRLPVPYGDELRTRLDLRSFPSSLRPVADEYPRIGDLEQVGDVRVEGHAVIVEMDDWHFRLEVVAEGDVSRDGYEDWLVWLIDEAHNGSYRDYSLLVIKRVDEKGCLRAATIK